MREQARPGAGATVLVVDDDEGVRLVVRRALEVDGFKVVEACDGVRALVALSERRGRVSLVLTDVVMSQMGGRELSAALSYQYPELPLLFMSGYPEDQLRKQGLVPETVGFVAKPFAGGAIAARVRTALGIA